MSQQSTQIQFPGMLADDAQKLQRRRALMETMLAQAGGGQGRMVGGHYIRGTNPLVGLASLAGGYLLSRDQDQLEAQARTRYQEDLAKGLQGYFDRRDGRPGEVMNDQQAEALMRDDVAPTLAEPVKADPRQAVIEALSSQHPILQQLGQMELSGMLKQKSAGLDVKDLLPYADPESIPQLLVQGAKAFQPKTSKRDVQDISIGGGLWQSFEVGPDGRVDMQRPIGQPFSKRPTASDVNIGNGDQIPKELAKAQPEIFKEARGQVQSAIRQIQTSDRIERLAQDPQIIAGALARPELLLQNLGARLGFTGPEAATKTQAMMRELAQATLANVKQLPGPLSEKELPFLEAASAGQIEFTPEAILRIARLQKAAAHNSLMDAYSIYKSNAGLAGGEMYKQAYPLPRQGSYQLDPSIYEVDEGNMATLRESTAASPRPAAGGQPIPLEQYLQQLRGGH